MATEKKFIEKAMNDLKINRFLERELRNAGISSIQIQKTPLATRIAITVRRPSMVIGKKGRTVKAISEALEKEFRIDNPQLDIMEVEKAELDAKLVAEKIGRQIEIEGNMKQIIRMNLRDVMSAGAIGAEIMVSGKIVGKGGKARTLRVRKGYLKKAGNVKKLVMTAQHTAFLKAGTIGITVKIVRPGTEFPDSVKIDYDKIGEQIEKVEEEEKNKEEAEAKEDGEGREEEKALEEKISKAKKKPARRKRHAKPRAKKTEKAREGQILTGETKPAAKEAEKEEYTPLENTSVTGGAKAAKPPEEQKKDEAKPAGEKKEEKQGTRENKEEAPPAGEAKE